MITRSTVLILLICCSTLANACTPAAWSYGRRGLAKTPAEYAETLLKHASAIVLGRVLVVEKFAIGSRVIGRAEIDALETFKGPKDLQEIFTNIRWATCSNPEFVQGEERLFVLLATDRPEGTKYYEVHAWRFPKFSDTSLLNEFRRIVQASPADSNCLWSPGPWSCFGLIELRQNKNSDGVVSRMRRYSNGELMAEVEGRGVKKQYLEVRPSRLALMSGLSELESPQPTGDNPFTYFALGFVLVVTSLQAAHPNGPSSVPKKWTETAVTVEKLPLIASVMRVSDSRVLFKLHPPGETSGVLEGTWDGRLFAPLSDDLDVTNWKHGETSVISTLREARMLRQ